MKKFAFLILILLTLYVSNSSAKALTKKEILKIIENSKRPDSQAKLDKLRKPIEVLSFFNAISKNDKVLDINAGSGYYTLIISYLVGKDGIVYAHEPDNKYGTKSKNILKKYIEKYDIKNIVIIQSKIKDLKNKIKENSIDYTNAVLTLHDTINFNSKKDALTDISTIYALLKKDHYIGIVDHIGIDGENNVKLHRITTIKMKRYLNEVKFKFISSSNLLKNKNDNHKLISRSKKISRKTDRMILKFKK